MPRRALEGITVLDFSQLIQGPFATMKLADMGAEVIKVERPVTGERYRPFRVMGELIDGESPFFHAINRNKESVTIDLKTEEGREICLRLAEEADVVVNNFRPAVMDRLGLSYEDLKAVNEELIYCQATGYGASGPYEDKPGQDLLIQSLTGLASVTGRADDPPTPTGVPIVDVYSAAMLAYGIVVALFHRERTGEGQRIDLNLFNSAVDMQAQEVTTVLNTDLSAERSEHGAAHPWFPAPYGIYETKDGHVSISSGVDVGALIDDLELTELEDLDTSRSATGSYSEDLFDRREEIMDAVGRRLREKTTAEWEAELDMDEHWMAPVQSYDELVSDPQLEHNDLIQSVEHPVSGDLELPGPPIEFSETPGEIRKSSPLLGESNESVLESLGYTAERIQALRDDGVIGDGGA